LESLLGLQRLLVQSLLGLLDSLLLGRDLLRGVRV
jgi:hypothetical protein